MLSFLLLALTVFVQRDFFAWLRIDRWHVIDVSVVFYFLVATLSLVFTETIQDVTPFRLLISGFLVYFLVQTHRLTSKEKRTFIHVLGGVAVLISAISLMQVAFPELMNAIADTYFKGRAAYGLSLEFQRGRLLHWGALIFVYPFFYSSVLLLKWRDRIWYALYALVGYISIMASMIMANFRWTFLVFALGTLLSFMLMLRVKLVNLRKLLLIGVFTVFIGVVGAFIAEMTFGYNLWDRFLLQNSHRDITETSGRILLLDQAATVFLAYPITGAGYGNYYSMVTPFPMMQLFRLLYVMKPQPIPLASHNEFFTVLAETGILGLIGFLLIGYFTAIQMYVLIRTRVLSLENRLLAITFFVSFVSYGLYVLFENMFPQNIIYILLIAGAAGGWTKENRSNV